MESNEDLVKLRSDLKELITLTEESLLSLKKSQLFSMLENTSDASSSSSASVPASHQTPAQHRREAPDLDAEFAAFQAAIAEDKQPSDNDESSQDLPCDNSEEEPTTGPEAPPGGDLPDLSDIIGTKCRAPFSQEWGGLHYQNALIFSVEPLTADSTPQVRVLFCHPTTPAMKPCSFFLESKCRFMEETCRFSHGHVVSVEDLQEYVEPDLSDIKLESRVRARYDDGLWYPAVVVEINENEESLKVMFDNYNEAETVDYEDIILLDGDAEGESDSEHEERTEAVSRSESEDEDDQLPVYLWRPNQTTDKLGQWETHTKGIGSRLMAKMGYIMGQGLGKESKGRAEPVPIQLLPQGKSLDKIMELKELAGDQDLYDVMKKAVKRKKKQEQKQEFSYKKETPKSVFDFINKKLHGKKGDLHSLVKKPSHHKTHSVTHISEGDLKKKSDRSINIQLLKTHEELQGVKKEMSRLKQSLQRNQGNNSVKKKLEQQLASLEQYKTQLQSSEISMQKHQQSRKDQRKLTIF